MRTIFNEMLIAKFCPQCVGHLTSASLCYHYFGYQKRLCFVNHDRIITILTVFRTPDLWGHYAKSRAIGLPRAGWYITSLDSPDGVVAMRTPTGPPALRNNCKCICCNTVDCPLTDNVNLYIHALVKKTNKQKKHQVVYIEILYGGAAMKTHTDQCALHNNCNRICYNTVNNQIMKDMCFCIYAYVWITGKMLRTPTWFYINFCDAPAF